MNTSDPEKPAPKQATATDATTLKPGQTTVSADLWMKVQVILSQASPVKYVFKGPDVSIFGATPKEPTFIETPGLYTRVNTQVDLLKKLYATFPPDVQEQFPKALLAQLSNANAEVVAHTLVELHYVNALRQWSRIDNPGIALWQAIEQKLRYEHWTFSPDDLKHVYSGMNGIHGAASGKMKAGGDTLSPDYRQGRDAMFHLDRLRKVTKAVEYVRLKDELLNFQNPALDTDRRELLSRLEVLGFSKALSEALAEIDRKTMVAATAFDFKSAMELVRTFLEEFVEEAAQKVATKSSVQLPPKDKVKSHFQPYKQYLRDAGIIVPDEEEILQKVYNYVSNAGSHVLGSTPEQFHVTRTTVIEWCLMIAGRVQAHLSK